jgi:hypothetical protein
MARYILRFTERGTPSDADLARIRSAPGVTVVDSTSPRMLLVEALPEAVGRLAEVLPDWTSCPERMVPLPDPRPRIRSS